MCSKLLKVNTNQNHNPKQNKKTGRVKNSSGKQLTIAQTVITHLGLGMLGNVSIDSYLMMDYVLK